MVNSIEISPSGRAKCSFCGKIINKGTPRGVFVETVGFRENKRYLCYECTLKRLDLAITNKNRMKRQFEEMIKEKQKEIILMELEND